MFDNPHCFDSDELRQQIATLDARILPGPGQMKLDLDLPGHFGQETTPTLQEQFLVRRDALEAELRKLNAAQPGLRQMSLALGSPAHTG